MKVKQAGRQVQLQPDTYLRFKKMLEEGTIRKMRNLLTSSSKLPPWTSVVGVYDERQVTELKVTNLRRPGMIDLLWL